MEINRIAIKSNTLTAICIVCFNLFCKAGDLIIVKGSQHASIIVSNMASPVERYAAEEFQRTIRLMSGVNLEIENSTATIHGARIVIGTPHTSKEIFGLVSELKLKGENPEEIAVLRKGNTLYLAGESPRAALYASYTFLEDVMGARWLWPGKSGEFLPKHDVISIEQLAIFQSPSIGLRSLAITGTKNGDPDTDTWMARNKMNNVSVPATASRSDEQKMNLRKEKGFLMHISGHNIVFPDSLLKVHPEYIAELSGRREFQPGTASQLCWSNPKVQDEVAQMIGSWWDQNPVIDAVNFYPADNQRYCQCEQCKAMGDVSTRWQKFSAIVIAKVEKTHPGKKYWTYAYQGYKSIPQIKPAPFEFIGYTLYDASYRHLLSSHNSYNKLPLTEIDGWLSKGVNLGIRGYEYIIFKDPMFVPLVSWVTDEMKWMKNKGLVGYASELPPYGSPKNALPENTYWNGSRMALYAAAKAMWNIDLSADSIVKDWCNTIYGPAADAMNNYYWQMDSAWRKADGKISVFKNSSAAEVDKFLSPEMFGKANAYFTKARTQIELLNDQKKQQRIEEQITLESKMLANWQKIYRYKKNLGSRYKTDIIKVQQPNDSLWQVLPRLAAFEDNTGKITASSTYVSLAWTSSALIVHVVSPYQDGKPLKAIYTKHDENVLQDDCIELFIQPDLTSAGCLQFAVNTKGTKYDAKTSGGMNFKKSWNPKWAVATSLEQNSWITTIQIPFSSLGIVAKDSVQFKIAIKRLGVVNSGWPDASSFNSANFAVATFVNKKNENINKKIILYDGGSGDGNLSVELQQQNWNVASNLSGEKELNQKLLEDAGVLLLRYSDKNWNLPDAFMANEIKSFLEKGRIVILQSTGDIPIEKWFSVPSVKWTGNENAPLRKSAFVLNGDWQNRPYNLRKVLVKNLTPQSAYVPLSEGWEILATINLKDGSQQPFLLTKHIGKGILVLTTSFMGYGGGFEMFGNRNAENVVKLIENLQAQLEITPGVK